MPFIKTIRGSFGPTGRFGRSPSKGFILGGDQIIESGGYRIHIFTTTGTQNFNTSGFTSPVNIEYLIIAGGGGTSNEAGGTGAVCGGGGAGGYRTSTISTSPGIYPVQVGNGGFTYVGAENSSWNNIISIAGGSSAAWGRVNGSGNLTTFGGQSNGGSGAGASSAYDAEPGYLASYNQGATTGTSGQGSNGGSSTNTGSSVDRSNSAGGGGAGGVGGNSSTTVGGAGGAGLSSSITGTAVTRASGGGGAIYSTTTGRTSPSATVGGGGRGTQYSSSLSFSGTSGASNTGGGGGGILHTGSFGIYQYESFGGSGIVVLRYTYP